MLNHTYTSVKNANLVDCGKKQHISSQPISLLKDNFLGEFRTDLEKKKVLANLGIATELSLEWQYIKGDIGGSEALMQELDSRTTYIARIGEFKDKVISVIEGIQYLETIVGSEQEGETVQNERLTELENKFKLLVNDLDQLNELLNNSIKTDIEKLNQDLEEISKQIANINDLIQISSKANNALVLIPEDSDQLAEGETPGLYVPNLEPRVEASEKRFEPIETNIESIQSDIESVKNNYVTKESLGGEGDFNFVKQTEYNSYVTQTNTTIGDILTELNKTVKTGEDGHVDTLYVNKISKNNDEGHIQIEDSFEMLTGSPIDVRFVKETLEDLLALPVNKCYSGMGVIVNSLSALYILRKPGEGVIFNQEYVSNIYNWKCPEDLVTVALSQSDYDSLSEINSNVFYYIYEEVIDEPNPNQYEGGIDSEEYKEAYERWQKYLQGEYISAGWAKNIEDTLAKKASNDSVSKILQQLNEIKGGKEGTSLDSLNTDIQNLSNLQNILIERVDNILSDDTNSGKLVDVENRILNIENDLPNYITEEELSTLSGGFDFVKPDVYESDKQQLQENLAKLITTEKLISSNIKTETIKISEGTIVNLEGSLQFNNQPIAKVSDIPVIKVMSQEEYDNIEEKESNTYYYTFDDDVIYVTKSELETQVNQLRTSISSLVARVTELENKLSEQ